MMSEDIRTVSVRSMRLSERAAMEAGISSRELMRRAGEGIFSSAEWKGPVAVMCGKGNNAGDGYAVASLMADAGIACDLFLLSDEFSEDGRYYFERCSAKGVHSVKWNGQDLSVYGSVLDCIFGTGFRGEVAEPEKSAIEAINGSGAFVVSADINSGINGDTGEGTVYVRSDLTVSIGCYKTGHFLAQGASAYRSIVIADLGIPIQEWPQ